MRFPLIAAFLSTVFVLTGCANGPWNAPPNAVFLEQDDVKVPWFGCDIDADTGLPSNPNCEPSDAVIFPLNISVLDVDTQQPLNNVRVSFTSIWHEIYVMPQEVLEAVTLPDTERWSDFDAGDETFAEFSGNFEGDYRPTFHDTWTDENGVARTWVYVDSLPQDDTGREIESSILVDMGIDMYIIVLQPSQ